MAPSGFRSIVYLLLACSLVACLLVCPAEVRGDQAQYFYDELGQLVGVVDGQGDTALYTYDEVGNLLSIERFTVGATGIEIFLLAPASGSIGAQVEVRNGSKKGSGVFA